MRRAARHAKMLGFAEPVLYRMVDAVRDMMGEAYPELGEREEYVKKVVRAEEERFAETLDRGLAILNEAVTGLKREQQTVIPGDTLFQLYDTYGFPVDLTADIVGAEGFTIDEAGFETCMERQRAQAREHWKGSGEEGIAEIYKTLHTRGLRSSFTGYGKHSRLLGGHRPAAKAAPVADAAQAGDQVDVITEATPFYGASGGQVGDTGTISSGSRPSAGARHPAPLPRPDRPPRPGRERHPAHRRGRRPDGRRHPTAWPRPATIPPPTCCRRPSSRCLATTSNRPVRWSNRSACASTSPTSPP